MEGAWLISYLVLWLLTLLLAVVVLAHSRLLGLLHHRLGPAGARFLEDGPALGTTVPRLEGQRLDGKAWFYQFPAPREALVVFLSPQCQSCNALLPHVKDFVRTQTDLDLILISTLDDLAMNRAYVAYLGLEHLLYIRGGRQAEALDISGTPFALFLDSAGVVRNKGVVNNYEHLLGLRRVPPGVAADAGAAGPEAEASLKGEADEATRAI